MEEVNMKTILKVKPKHQHSTIFIRFCDVAEANLPMINFFRKSMSICLSKVVFVYLIW